MVHPGVKLIPEYFCQDSSLVALEGLTWFADSLALGHFNCGEVVGNSIYRPCHAFHRALCLRLTSGTANETDQSEHGLNVVRSL